MNDANRQTGRTTRQMRAAPLNAIYICPMSDRRYWRRLAHWLGRLDLVLVEPTYRLENVLTPVRVDHAANLPDWQWERVKYINRRLKDQLQSPT